MRAVLLAAACSLLLAAPAGAQSLAVAAAPPEPELLAGADTLALVDGGVAWMEQRGTGAALMVAGADGVARELLALPAVAGAPRRHGVVASGTTLIARRLVCADERCARNAALEVLRVDLATGAVTAFDPCLGGADCPRAACSFGLALHGSVLTASRCARQTAVADLADGTVRQLDGGVLGAAGAHAVQLVGRSTLRVLDWRTGRLVSEVDGVYLDPRVNEASIIPDGTAAWADGGSVKVLAPGAGRARTIALPEFDGITEARLAGGRLAVRRWRPGEANELRVSALDGTGLRELDGQRGSFGWAFDGARLAWVAQPCAQPVIRVWDLAGEPPPAAGDRCARPRVGSRSLRLSRRGTRVGVRLSCPASPARGCAGDIAVKVLSRGRRLTESSWQEYRIAAGATRTETLRILRHKRLRGASRLVARVLVDTSANPNPSVTRLRLAAP